MSESGANVVAGALEILSASGEVASTFLIDSGVHGLGRRSESDADLGFPDDAQMADHHAQISVDAETGRVSLADQGEGSGVWIRISGPEGRPLVEADQLWLGSQIVVIRQAEDGWQIDHHGPSGQWIANHEVAGDGIFIGRSGDVPLDPTDTQLSRRHAQLVPEEGELRVYDRGAHNGTFLRLTAPENLEDGAEFRIAGQRLRFVAHVPEVEVPSEPEPEPAVKVEVEVAEEATLLSVLDVAEEAVAEPSEREEALSASPETEPAKRGGLAARLKSLGDRIRAGEDSRTPDASSESEATVVAALPPELDEATVLSELPQETKAVSPVDVADEERSQNSEERAEPIDPVLIVIDSEAGSISMTVESGTTVLEAVQSEGIPRGETVDWECGDGGCGVCIVGVVEGADRMDPPDPSTGEMKTIQITEQVAPDPRLYRLACLARVRGTVRLRKLT